MVANPPTDDRAMSTALGAILAAAAGGITGALVALVRRTAAASPGPAALALVGLLLAPLVYGVFLVAGAVVSLFTFSEPHAALPALLGTVFVCAGCLLAAWIEAHLGSFAARFGLPEPRKAFEERGFDAILEAQPQGGRATMWIGGVGLALLPVIGGIQTLVSQQGTLGTTLWRRTLEGGPAISLGIGLIGVGAFLHFHFFFGLHPRLREHSHAGKKLALFAACAGFGIASFWAIGTP
jgi:hypothetical protein